MRHATSFGTQKSSHIRKCCNTRRARPAKCFMYITYRCRFHPATRSYWGETRDSSDTAFGSANKSCLSVIHSLLACGPSTFTKANPMPSHRIRFLHTVKPREPSRSVGSVLQNQIAPHTKIDQAPLMCLELVLAQTRLNPPQNYSPALCSTHTFSGVSCKWKTFVASPLLQDA